MTFNLLCFIKKFKLAGVVLVLGYYFMSCKSLDPTAQFPQMQIPTPQSSVNVPLDIPMTTLATLANQAVPSGIFDEKGMDLGNGVIGDLNFSRNLGGNVIQYLKIPNRGGSFVLLVEQFL